MIELSWLIPVSPLLGFLLIGILGKRVPKSVISIIGCGSILLSFIIVLTILFPFLSGEAEPVTKSYFTWINSGKLSINFSFLIDRLSVLMMTIITGVGFLIHVYSVGYMHHDEGFHRYFAYLNLFVFSMLLLVMGSNYVVLFAGWEGVGLCSYLLIGFWFKNTEYNKAARKAFVMNRIGDLGFLLGMLFIFYHFNSLEFAEVFERASNPSTVRYDGTIITIITLLLFLGATGKSAQIPLYTWLPDAMAGPTPVSALIHAATMVTAGIYMIVRSNVLFALAPFTGEIIMIIGLATALFAATIALVQNDIKKVLAYSTVSQLGYMFFALGLGAYSAAMFHLTTHAFFKALLFLGAGSVIHAMSNEQDIRKMGGLKKSLPVTYITFLIGTVAIAGLPPFAGFFSKDQILSHAFEHSPFLWGLGLAGALMTAFYMFRLFFLTFHGEFRGSEHQKSHLHESPWSMTVPLIVLAILSAVAGFIGVPNVLQGNNAIQGFLAPVLTSVAAADPALTTADAHHQTIELILMGVSTGLVAAIIFLAFVMYVKKKRIPAGEEKERSSGKNLLYNKYYIDEFYDSVFVKPFIWLSNRFYSLFEIRVIDSFVNSWGKGVSRSGQVLKLLQNGSISYYLFAMVVGIILILSIIRFRDLL